MKARSYPILIVSLLLLFSILACNMPSCTAQTPTSTPTSQVIVITATTQPEAANPAAAVTATQTTPAEPTLTPTVTIPPATATQQPTNTPLPCNQVSFVNDVSVPDGTVFQTNQAFTKTWRLKNTGSCTWTSGYQVVFFNGDQMSGPAGQTLTSGTVPPNSTIDVSVNLIAPGSAGTYRGNWKLRDPNGVQFGLSTGPFWVEIKAEAPAAPPPAPEVKLPDLFVSEFTITPTTPIKGQPAHARIGIYNQGNAVASQFTVVWYGLSTFANPSCTWDIMDNVNPNGGRILQCDFVFQSPYPIDKSSLVIVDTTNHVQESNEANNQASISPFGVNNP